MKRALLTALVVISATAGIAAALPAAPPAKAATQQDWTRVVAATPEGGFRVGNPEAPVKLVEYGSLTCDHCARFAEEGVPQLLGKYVKGGRVSFEFRNFVRDPADLTAALLSRCIGAKDYFALTHNYFAAQKDWIGRFSALTQEQAKALQALPREQQLAQVAKMAGLDSMAAKAGLPATRVGPCLGDTKALTQLMEMHKVATQQHKLQGTPTFLINGKLAEGAHDWAALEPLLRPPGG